jgi:arylformamidase
MEPSRIIDISQPIENRTACFPGDVPFSRNITISHAESHVINLTAFTMSPHVGTHADAPVHVRGSLPDSPETVDSLPLAPFIGPAAIIDVSPWTQAITWHQVKPQLERLPQIPARILFKTAKHIRYDVFEKEYAWFDAELIRELAKHNIQLIGIDTPSVDAVDSKTLDTHHALLDAGIYWLENLDLTAIKLDNLKTYFLLAAPLKFLELEASPVRAVLLEFPI